MNIGIVGLGLIGASLGKTVRKVGGHVVYGYDIESTVNVKAKLVGAVDYVLDDKSVKNLDIVFFAVYPRALENCLEKFLPKLKDGCLVVDLSGIKRQPVETLKRLSEKYKKLNFISVHTMAGREYSGIERSLSTLFNNASAVITTVKADIYKIEELKNFLLSLGFYEVVFSTSENHDETIAYTSQLCHIVSNAYIKSPTAKKHFGYSAGSYKDLTRVARLNSKMWSELMIDNKDNLKKELSLLIDNLSLYLSALENGDENKLKDLLEEGNLLKIEIDSGKTK